MSEFYVGQRVVCVDDKNHLEWPENNGCVAVPLNLESGRDYIVCRIVIYGKKQFPRIFLKGVDRKSPFHLRRFRPLESKAIELFRQIAADPSRKLEDA